MSHFLYPSNLITRLPHLDRIFENLIERQLPTDEEVSQTSDANSINCYMSTTGTQTDKDSNNISNISDEHKCWICLDLIDTSKQQWTRPCKCSLVSHQQCLLSWIAENQRFSPRKKVYCPQCSSLYVLSEEDSLPLTVMNLTDNALHGVMPYLTILGLGCSILITSTSFGIFTVFTLFGREKGESIIGDSKHWSWKTWLGLPAIPAVLIGYRLPDLDKFFPFISAFVLRLSNSSQKSIWPPSPAILFGSLSCMRLIYNHIYKKIQYKLVFEQRSREDDNVSPYLDYSEQYNTSGIEESLDISGDDDRDSRVLFMREKTNDLCFTVAGALLWPTISSIIGGYLSYSKLIRKYLPEPFQRNILGGCLFVIAKDAFNLYYKYERLQQHRSRKVVNYR